jgi:hypothetical protein
MLMDIPAQMVIPGRRRQKKAVLQLVPQAVGVPAVQPQPVNFSRRSDIRRFHQFTLNIISTFEGGELMKFSWHKRIWL